MLVSSTQSSPDIWFNLGKILRPHPESGSPGGSPYQTICQEGVIGMKLLLSRRNLSAEPKD